MSRSAFKVLANPGNGCWLVRVPDLDQSATVESERDIENSARETVAICAPFNDAHDRDLADEDLGNIRLEIEILPRRSTYPIPGRWLSPGADYKINAALGTGYGLPD
jgi:hypothetical protein